MKNIFKTLFLIVSCFLFAFSQKTNVVVTRADEITEFYNEFDDLSNVDIGYGQGNNTTFISHGYTYYASSFSFNSVHNELRFGRSTAAITNISNEDEFRMEFDLGGYVEYLKLDIGTVSTTNIEFKVQYSTDFGKSYSDIDGSLTTIVANSTYSLLIDDNYEFVRYKFVIANVNEKAGKNMVIKNLRITGNNLYTYSLGHLVRMIDDCTCDNIRLNYENIVSEYDKLSDNDKIAFDNLLTEDGQTTYKERFDYYLNICSKENGSGNSNNGSILSSNGLTSAGVENFKNNYLPLVYVLIAISFVTIIYFLVIKNKSKKSE